MVPRKPPGGNRRLLPITLLLLTTALTGVWILRTPRGQQPVASNLRPQSQPRAEAPRREYATDAYIPENLDLLAGKVHRPFKLALDQVVAKQPTGEFRPVKLDPPATPATLAGRMAQLHETNPVFPVCYPEGVEHNQYTLHIITPDITVKLPEGSNVLPLLPPGVQVKDRPAYAPGFAVLSAPDSFAAIKAAQELRDTTSLAMAEVQLAYKKMPMAMPNDPLITKQWHLKYQGQPGSVAGTDINVESVWQYPTAGKGIRGRGVRVAVIDDSLQISHPDFAGNIDPANCHDYNDGDSDPSPVKIDDDHGTSCAGDVAARGNNSIGGSGSAPEATLVGFRLISDATTDSQDASAFTDLNTGPNLVDVKTNSWGPAPGYLAGPGPLADAAIQDGTVTGRNNLGVVYLFAGGNSGADLDNANYDGYVNSIYVIGVAATDSAGNQAYYSEPGSNLLISGPSSGQPPTLGITTTDRTGSAGYDPTNYTSTFGGTSSATPTVAGVVALMLEANPALGWRDVQEILLSTAKKIDPTDLDWAVNSAGFHFNHKFGAGLVDAAAAVTAAKGWTNLADQQVTTKTATGTPVDIPDNNTTGKTVNFNLPLSNLRVEHATVTVNLTHPSTGDLDIILTSPAGTISHLAAPHNYSSSQFVYAPWTFSTTHCWGENSKGVWTLQVADRKAGDTGTLTSATLTLYGTPDVPRNPPPLVTITDPATGSIYSPGATVPVNITASDLTAAGDPGVVSKIELYDNDVLIGTDLTSPYGFTLNPANGTHVYKAKATDSQGASRFSGPVTIRVFNQPPVITTALITPAPQAFSDQAVTVTSLASTDPENDPITYSYQWQSSTDTFVYTSVTGLTTATLPAAAANAGLVWRCLVTASDGQGNSVSQATNSVNILTRPPTTVAQGGSLSYNSGLIIRATDNPILRTAIINEFSQGSDSNPTASGEWVEILVMKKASLRKWRFTNAANNQLVFSDNKVWDNIPAGTLIVIYNGGTGKDPLLPKDDAKVTDKTLVLSSNNGTYFSRLSSWPGFANAGDSVILRDSTFAMVAQFSYGLDNTVTPNIGSLDAGMSAAYTGNSDAGADDPANWKVSSAATSHFGASHISAVEKRGLGSIPIEFGGPWTTAPANMFFDGIVPYYASLDGDTSPGSAKFNNGDNPATKVTEPSDQITIAFNGTPDRLGYSIAATGNKSYTTLGSFSVNESADGANWTPVRIIDNKPYGVTHYDDPLKPTSRFVQFSYDTMIKGYLLLDKVTIYPVNPIFLSATPTKFVENAGPNASVGTIRVLTAPAADLTFTLTSSDTTAVTVPDTVVLPAGQTTVTFPIAAVDDLISDGTQLADISVSADTYTTNSVTVTVTDDEPVIEGVTPVRGNVPLNAAFVASLRDGSLIHTTFYRLGAASNPLPTGLTLNTSTGLISGIVAAGAQTGPYNIVLENYNFLGEVNSISFTLTVTSAAPGLAPMALVTNTGRSVSSSSNTSGPSGGVAADGSADSDGDGIGDLAEHYLGGNPNVADAEAHTPVVETTDTTASIIFVRSDDAAKTLDGIVEWATTLPDGPWSTAGVTEEILEQSNGWSKVRATVSNLPTEPKKYLRLRVTAKP